MRVFVFKPDGIGDFVLATGAIRLLARECGEQNLTLCVKTILVPLARDQFPTATVLDLPTAAERRVVNLFVRNFFACLPLRRHLRVVSFDAAVCLRSMRNYLETFLFYSARARRFVACENILLRSGRKVRAAVERTVARWMRPELAAYPASAALPLELEANRVVVERLLGRPVAPKEVLPDLRGAASGETDTWIWAPITNLQSKVYPFARWIEIFEDLRPLVETKSLRLVGGPGDEPLLSKLLSELHARGFAKAEIHFPADLAAFVRVLAAAELVMSVDTAAAHFATALDRPTVVLFSGLHLGMFGPWRRSARQAWLLPDPPPEGAKKSKWHTRLAPARVAAAVRAVLPLDPACTP